MAEITFNGNKTRRVPINRNSLFYDKESYDFEMELGKNYIEQDMGQAVVLYQVDVSKTQTDSVYGETNPGSIVYKPPVEIPCLYEIEDSELKTYDKKTSNGVYALSGNITVYMMPKMLEKYDTDIMRGDYIGVQIDTDRMVYFSVTDDGKVNTSNRYHVGAYKTAWRVIKGSPVSDYEFKGE